MSLISMSAVPRRLAGHIRRRSAGLPIADARARFSGSSLIVLLTFAMMATEVNAQGREIPSGSGRSTVSPGLFQPGVFIVGPSALVGNLGGGTLAPGVELEYGLIRMNSSADPGGAASIGPGVIGVGFRAHTYSSSLNAGAVTASWRVTPVVIAANYHFVMTSPKLDPYLGLALGYASVSYSDSQGSAFSAGSGTYLMIDGGGRFYFNPRTAIQAGLSLGSRGDVGLLRVAAMFQL